MCMYYTLGQVTCAGILNVYQQNIYFHNSNKFIEF